MTSPVWRSSRSRPLPLHARALRSGHSFCPNHPERLVPIKGHYCFLCEKRDEAFEHLDFLIRSGHGDTPQVKLPQLTDKAKP